MKIITEPKIIDEILNRGTIVEIIPSKKEFRKLLLSGKRLKFYIGFDPTAPTLHLSHAKNLILMEKFRLPVLYIEARSCGEAWIKTVKAVWDHGKIMPNHYEDVPSKEATVTVNVIEPLSEPRIHKADYVSMSDIKLNPTYVDEVLNATMRVEVRAEDMDALCEAARKMEFVAECKREKDLMILYLSQETDASIINKNFVSQGIYLSHLAMKKRSLESYFLELLTD